MKNLLRSIAVAILFTTLYNCSIEPIDNSESQLIIEETQAADVNVCIGDNPEVRFTNNGDYLFSLDIFNEDGDLLGFVHDLAPGDTSTWISFPTGETLFSVSNLTPNVMEEKVVYTMNTCMIFDIEIGNDNQLTSAVPEQL